jgi:hypothetical protein
LYEEPIITHHPEAPATPDMATMITCPVMRLILRLRLGAVSKQFKSIHVLTA